jgi:hypothetical protein
MGRERKEGDGCLYMRPDDHRNVMDLALCIFYFGLGVRRFSPTHEIE